MWAGGFGRGVELSVVVAIHKEANVEAQHSVLRGCFAYFDKSWVVHGGPRLQVPCSGRMPWK